MIYFQLKNFHCAKKNSAQAKISNIQMQPQQVIRHLRTRSASSPHQLAVSTIIILILSSTLLLQTVTSSPTPTSAGTNININNNVNINNNLNSVHYSQQQQKRIIRRYNADLIIQDDCEEVKFPGKTQCQMYLRETFSVQFFQPTDSFTRYLLLLLLQTFLSF